ncbi:hypothetical protein C8A03DRAFT_48136 [Achaetomium macrosporum]|uniref:Uncharacterized protein n=1 Tax=Achaetomium macrosporum TaxID=79813 RepID=A0AAN7H6M6_9PEZI|nr:hypothetical protein C8A03DRAFT_48136 [Achaetomium macrosporum]
MEQDEGGTAHESQSDQVTLLLQQLDNFERAPKTLPESWREVQQAVYDSTARIFLDEGQFPAWLAYFLTKNAANKQSHFNGKAKLNQLVNDLEKQTIASRRLLAARVGTAIPPERRERINSLHKKTMTSSQISPNSTKRRHNNGCPPTVSKILLSPNAIPRSVHRHHDSLSRTAQVPAHSVDSSSCSSEDKQVLVNASLKQAIYLFPPDLSDSIKRHPNPRNGNILTIGCQMSLEVIEDKVQHLARELLQYLRSGRTKIMPNPKLTLTGYRRDVLSSTFGCETSGTIEKSPKYQDEAMQWHDTTDYISIVISASAQEGAVIYTNKLFR